MERSQRAVARALRAGTPAARARSPRGHHFVHEHQSRHPAGRRVCRRCRVPRSVHRALGGDPAYRVGGRHRCRHRRPRVQRRATGHRPAQRTATRRRRLAGLGLRADVGLRDGVLRAAGRPRCAGWLRPAAHPVAPRLWRRYRWRHHRPDVRPVRCRGGRRARSRGHHGRVPSGSDGAEHEVRPGDGCRRSSVHLQGHDPRARRAQGLLHHVHGPAQCGDGGQRPAHQLLARARGWRHQRVRRGGRRVRAVVAGTPVPGWSHRSSRGPGRDVGSHGQQLQAAGAGHHRRLLGQLGPRQPQQHVPHPAPTRTSRRR